MASVTILTPLAHADLLPRTQARKVGIYELGLGDKGGGSVGRLKDEPAVVTADAGDGSGKRLHRLDERAQILSHRLTYPLTGAFDRGIRHSKAVLTDIDELDLKPIRAVWATFLRAAFLADCNRRRFDIKENIFCLVGLPISPFAGTNSGHGIVALAAKAGDCQVLALVVLDEEPAVFVERDTSAS
jgi:hypothetical protein